MMRFTLPFVATASPSSVVTVCTGSIEFDHIITRISFDGSDTAYRNVIAKVFTSEDDDTPSSGEPSGTNVIPSFAQAAYITIGSRKIQLDLNYRGREGSFLKLYLENSDTVNEQTVYGYVTIEQTEVKS